MLEEEFGNALTLNEDLQVQHEQMMNVKCHQCAMEASNKEGFLSNMSSEL